MKRIIAMLKAERKRCIRLEKKNWQVEYVYALKMRYVYVIAGVGMVNHPQLRYPCKLLGKVALMTDSYQKFLFALDCSVGRRLLMYGGCYVDFNEFDGFAGYRLQHISSSA